MSITPYVRYELSYDPLKDYSLLKFHVRMLTNAMEAAKAELLARVDLKFPNVVTPNTEIVPCPDRVWSVSPNGKLRVHWKGRWDEIGTYMGRDCSYAFARWENDPKRGHCIYVYDLANELGC